MIECVAVKHLNFVIDFNEYGAKAHYAERVIFYRPPAYLTGRTGCLVRRFTRRPPCGGWSVS
jgi:hypothetical protein